MELDRADEVAPGPEGRDELDASSEETPLVLLELLPQSQTLESPCGLLASSQRAWNLTSQAHPQRTLSLSH